MSMLPHFRSPGSFHKNKPCCKRTANERQCTRIGFLIWLLVVLTVFPQTVSAADAKAAKLTIPVHSCSDFEVNGRGDAPQWKATDWVALDRRGGKLDYTARFKILYSPKGIYVLFDGTDKKLTATFDRDFEDLWTEDVYECFFWTDERDPIYFEYEISPLGYELPIIIPNLGGQFLGWRPWHYEGDRKTRKQVAVTGGRQKSLAAVTAWRAEIFFPYSLLAPLRSVPPKPDTKWRANFYRVDHDAPKSTAWSWAKVGSSFHDYRNFGTLTFK